MHLQYIHFCVLTHVFNAFRCFTEELGKGDQGGLRGERRDGFGLQKHKEIVKLFTLTHEHTKGV